MLNITMSDSEKRLLEKSNLFINDDIMSFCLILSYGNIHNIMNEKNKSLESWNVDIQAKMKELNRYIKNNSCVRIWYSNSDNEDVCNMCFLLYYLSQYKINIYLTEIKYGIGSCSEKDLIKYVDKKTLIDNKFINKYKELWIKLEKENSDIRIVSNDKIVSYDFKYLDDKIMDILGSKELRYYGLIGECMIKRLCNFYSDVIFKNRIDYLIENNYIIITKIVKEKNIFGKDKEVKYLKNNT